MPRRITENAGIFRRTGAVFSPPAISRETCACLRSTWASAEHARRRSMDPAGNAVAVWSQWDDTLSHNEIWANHCAPPLSSLARQPVCTRPRLPLVAARDGFPLASADVAPIKAVPAADLLAINHVVTTSASRVDAEVDGLLAARTVERVSDLRVVRRANRPASADSGNRVSACS
jgi:hypothetical protein